MQNIMKVAEAGDESVEALTRGLRVRVRIGKRTNRRLSFTEQPGAPRVHGAPPNPFERDAVPMITTSAG